MCLCKNIPPTISKPAAMTHAPAIAIGDKTYPPIAIPPLAVEAPPPTAPPIPTPTSAVTVPTTAVSVATTAVAPTNAVSVATTPVPPTTAAVVSIAVPAVAIVLEVAIVFESKAPKDLTVSMRKVSERAATCGLTIGINTSGVANMVLVVEVPKPTVKLDVKAEDDADNNVYTIGALTVAVLATAVVEARAVKAGAAAFTVDIVAISGAETIMASVTNSASDVAIVTTSDAISAAKTTSIPFKLK